MIKKILRPICLLSFFTLTCFSSSYGTWFLDQDNSMTPVSSKKGVGAAMANVITEDGRMSQAVQVCPGVYLATAHGVLDNPLKAQEENRPFMPPSKILSTLEIGPYPLSEDTLVSDVKSYASPRIDDPSLWEDFTTDYIFIRVNKPLKPNHFVRPIRASTERIAEASSGGEIKVYRYRPLANFDEELTFSKALKNHEKPQKVNGACEYRAYDEYRIKDIKNFSKELKGIDFELNIIESKDSKVDGEGYIHLTKDVSHKLAMDLNPYSSKKLSSIRTKDFLGSSCPGEPGVSGAPEVTRIKGQDYLVGVHTHSLSNKPYGHYSDDSLKNIILNSSKFCRDYEALCGKPCANLDKLLPKK